MLTPLLQAAPGAELKKLETMADRLPVNTEWRRFGLCSRLPPMTPVAIIRRFMRLVTIINVVGRTARTVNYLKCGAQRAGSVN